MKKPSLITRLRKRLQNRQGQSTTEYILILAIVVLLASKMKSQVGTIFGKSVNSINSSFDEFNSTQIGNP